MNMEWLEQLLGKEWSLVPAGGVTGDAYIAQNGQQKLFLKAEYIALFSGIVSRRNCSKITLDKKGNEW